MHKSRRGYFKTEACKNVEIQNFKKYDLGANFDIEDILTNKTLTILDIVDLTFKTEGVDDKILLTITSIDAEEAEEIIFYGRNMYLRTAPIRLLMAEIIAIDDCGVNGTMNFIIHTKDWKRKNPVL